MMAQQQAKKVGALEDGVFCDMPYYLWRCNDCQGYFAAGETQDDDGVMLVGLVTAESMFEQNCKLNRIRRRWSNARERGDVCTCNYHADWPTADDLHLRLPESAQEWAADTKDGDPA